MIKSKQNVQLTRFAWLSVAAALATIGLKAAAYFLTGSVGLLSDALESGVNLVAALVALWALSVAARPPDEEHAYGHFKAEYFSSGVEGGLILVAAVTIVLTAVNRLLHPQPLEQLGIGLLVSAVAGVLNFVVARILLRAGQQYQSVALEADAHHLLTDVWTSAGVLLGVGAVAVTHWQPLDAIIAILVGIQIMVSGWRLLRKAALGLMDTALPAEEVGKITAVLDHYCQNGVTYHALRTRQSGQQRFVSFHIQVPGAWTVHRGHTLLEEMERDIRAALGRIAVFTHLEPREDPASWHDMVLNRDDQTQ